MEEASHQRRSESVYNVTIARQRLAEIRQKRRAMSLPPSAQNQNDIEQAHPHYQTQMRVLAGDGPRVPDWILVMNGIHLFCGVPIYTMPYALRQGGWSGLAVLVLFAIFTHYSSQLLRDCLRTNQGLETFADIGGAAYGYRGRYAFIIVEFILAYASCVESIIIIRDLLTPVSSKVSFGVYVIYFGVFVVFFFLTVVVRDFSYLDRLVTGYGVGLTVIGVMTLFWIFLLEGYIPNQTSFIHLSGFPMTFGFCAYAYAGHPYLPELYTSLVTKESYSRVLAYIYVTSTGLYFINAILGYLMFAENVESIYLLSLNRDSILTAFAIAFVVIHQVMRFTLGVWPMAKAIESLALRLHLEDRARLCIGLVCRGVIVFTAIYLSLVAPIYGPLMSFLGSLLGTIVALIIPCSCYLRITYGLMGRAKEIYIWFIIIVSFIGATLGALKSLKEMREVI